MLYMPEEWKRIDCPTHTVRVFIDRPDEEVYALRGAAGDIFTCFHEGLYILYRPTFHLGSAMYAHGIVAHTRDLHTALCVYGTSPLV
jgi:hypothetical protein